MSRIDFSRWQP